MDIEEALHNFSRNLAVSGIENDITIILEKEDYLQLLGTLLGKTPSIKEQNENYRMWEMRYIGPGPEFTIKSRSQ